MVTVIMIFALGQQPANADVDKFLIGMKPYQRAKYTQDIVVTNDLDRIYAVPIKGLIPKWHQSGGMEGIDKSEFKSVVYKNDKAGEVKVFQGPIQVKNSLGYFQPNIGYKREYPNGSKFMDVLSSNGKVFEVRKREKIDGKWDSSILFRNVNTRPKGYKGLTISCASCHEGSEGPGTGGYATGLVPGGDGVLSDPFVDLEKTWEGK